MENFIQLSVVLPVNLILLFMIAKYIGTFIVILAVVIIIGLFVKKDKPANPNPTYNNKMIKNVQMQKSSNGDSKNQYRIGITYSGNKTEIINLLKGRAEFDVDDEETGNFNAAILKPDGKPVALLAEGNEPFKKNCFVDITETGTYLVDIKSAGEWSLSMK